MRAIPAANTCASWREWQHESGDEGTARENVLMPKICLFESVKEELRRASDFVHDSTEWFDGSYLHDGERLADITARRIVQLVRPLYFGGGCHIPKRIALCPECLGELTARSLQWDAGTGEPDAAAIEITCAFDGKAE
jgi:hypothetical protein